jgi:hypothetical protein
MILRRFVLLLVFLAASCASGRAGNPVYRRDIGTATLGDAVTLAEQVINRRPSRTYALLPTGRRVHRCRTKPPWV